MGLFSSKCGKCGSLDHATSDCPHGLFSSKCGKCGSLGHATKDCPHGLFSSKCGKCGSKSHATSDCPHGLFSSKCDKCGSKNHKTSNCPHGLFSSKCGKCGSKNHSTSDCPHGLFGKRGSSIFSIPKEEGAWIFFFVKWAMIITIVIFVFFVAIFLAPLILLIWYLVKKREIQWIAIVGILIATYLTYDILYGGFVSNDMMNIRQTGEERYLALGYFIVLVITLGFLLDKYTSENIPISTKGNFFEKRNIQERRPIIVGFSFLLLTIFLIIQFAF